MVHVVLFLAGYRQDHPEGGRERQQREEKEI
jgi:hypothetical protein